MKLSNEMLELNLFEAATLYLAASYQLLSAAQKIVSKRL